MDEYVDFSNAETLAPALLRQRFGAAWYARWRDLADEAAQWLAIALAEECALRPTASPTDALAGVARRPDARRALAGHDVDALLAQLMAAELLPARVGSRE